MNEDIPIVSFHQDVMDAVARLKLDEETTKQLVVFYSKETFAHHRGNSRQRRKAHRHNNRVANRFFQRFEGRKFERPVIDSDSVFQ